MFVCRERVCEVAQLEHIRAQKEDYYFSNFTTAHGRGRVSTEYITLWHTNGCYVRAGAGTSHGYRDEVLTAIFNSSFLMRPLYPRFFFSLFSRFFARLLTPRRKAPSTNLKIRETPRVTYFRLF